MKSIRQMSIVPLIQLERMDRLGPTVMRAKQHDIPDLYRLIATVRKVALEKTGPEESEASIVIDDFSSFEDAEGFAARMMNTFPRMTRSGSSDIGETIRLAVASSFEVEVKSIQARSRKKAFVIPRHATNYLGRAIRTDDDGNRLSLTEVGAITNRDHTTVIHSLKLTHTLINRRDRCRAYDDFTRRLCRAERTLRCAGFRFHHEPPIAFKLGA